MTDKLLVNAENLHFGYQSQQKILHGINLTIPYGKVVAIMGPSGTGKTTLLRLISKQVNPVLGKITVFNHDLAQISRTNLYQLRKKMGMLFQGGALFTHLNVYENVAYPLREHTNFPEALIKTLVLLKLQMVGLRGAYRLMPSELSGGMVRRVALARAIALDPDLMMYDEPFAGQDPITKGVLCKLIRTLHDALKLTTVIVSHDVPETLNIADIVYIVAHGVVLGYGTPQEIKHHPAKDIQQFIAGLPYGPVPFNYPAPNVQEDFLGMRN